MDAECRAHEDLSSAHGVHPPSQNMGKSPHVANQNPTLSSVMVQTKPKSSRMQHSRYRTGWRDDEVVFFIIVLTGGVLVSGNVALLLALANARGFTAGL